MNRIEKLGIVLLGLGLLVPAGALEYSLIPLTCTCNCTCTPAPAQPCSTKVIAPIDPRELESASPPVAAVEDPRGDFFLDHPLFKEIFDVVYESNDAIPPAVDIRSVEVALEGDNYIFQIRTAGRNLTGLLREGQHSARFGVYVDRDLNGDSDVLLTTSDQPERGVVVTPDFETIEDMPRLAIEDGSVTMSVSRDIVGDHFDWVAFSGYSPQEEAYYQTPLERVFFVPVVDVAYAGLNRTVGFSSSLSRLNPVCQVTKSGIKSCPPLGNPLGRKTIQPNLEGWSIEKKQCGNLGYEWWCYGSSWNQVQNRWMGGAFGKQVSKGASMGWIAKCPFLCGLNDQWDVDDPPKDNVPDRVFHTIVDAPCPTCQPNDPCHHPDLDNDNMRDTMIHEYSFAINLVESSTIHRDPITNAQIGATLYCAPKPPYGDPYSVPSKCH